jgi:hypothetical protein
LTGEASDDSHSCDDRRAEPIFNFQFLGVCKKNILIFNLASDALKKYYFSHGLCVLRLNQHIIDGLEGRDLDMLDVGYRAMS